MKILVFILLKIIEINLFVFVPYLTGLIGNKIFGMETPRYNKKIDIWVNGMLYITIPIAICAFMGILIVSNWEWSGKLIG